MALIIASCSSEMPEDGSVHWTNNMDMTSFMPSSREASGGCCSAGSYNLWNGDYTSDPDTCNAKNTSQQILAVAERVFHYIYFCGLSSQFLPVGIVMSAVRSGGWTLHCFFLNPESCTVDLSYSCFCPTG